MVLVTLDRRGFEYYYKYDMLTNHNLNFLHTFSGSAQLKCNPENEHNIHHCLSHPRNLTTSCHPWS